MPITKKVKFSIAACILLTGGELSGAAHGQNPVCRGASGPDVIASNIYNVANYASLGDVEAFGFGTEICNMGTGAAAFVSFTNAHPILAQAMYRLKEGRFEQIGISWVYHTFLSLAENSCGCQCTGQPGSAMGRGCSTPETASITGSQSSLGPRRQVNPATGFFNYPFAHGDQGTTGNSIYKRLQVSIADLDPTLDGGGQYFAEIQILAADDAAAGNARNNASHRAIVITGSGTSWTAAISAPLTTVRGRPAIRAWKAADPAVVETDVEVPGDGLLILAARATQVGEVLWQYEYALHNLNSHRAVGAFTIPIPPDASITEIGFHDVNYHSGEPFDVTDWPATVAPGAVRWTTEEFAQNENANALRWGTLYNFRFAADRPPGPIFARLDLFRPGSPSVITAATVGPIADSVICPDSNVCTDDWLDEELGCQHAFNHAPCDDGDPCTQNDTCDGAGSCGGVPYVFGDVFPPGTGDGIVEVGDITCLLEGYADLNACPDGDLIPCGMGDGIIEMGDILAGLDGYAGINACPFHCPE